MQGLKELPSTSGIYKITNLINGHSYIGQALNIFHRCNNNHVYGATTKATSHYHIYQAFNKYGQDNFKVEVIELCPPEKLNEREVYWIKYYDTFKNGYNMTPGGTFFSPTIHSPKTEEKRRLTREKNQSLKGENHPRAKMTNEEVIEVRERYIQGESINSIYKDYCNIYHNFGTFQNIVLGRSYHEVGHIPTKEAKNAQHGNRKFTSEQIINIRKQYYEQCKTQQSIAEQFGVSQSVIKDIVNYETYKEVNADIKNNRKRKNYRFSADEVREIRKLAAEGATSNFLANKYNVNTTVINKCVKRETYKSIQ